MSFAQGFMSLLREQREHRRSFRILKMDRLGLLAIARALCIAVGVSLVLAVGEPRLRKLELVWDFLAVCMGISLAVGTCCHRKKMQCVYYGVGLCSAFIHGLVLSPSEAWVIILAKGFYDSVVWWPGSTSGSLTQHLAHICLRVAFFGYALAAGMTMSLYQHLIMCDIVKTYACMEASNPINLSAETTVGTTTEVIAAVSLAVAGLHVVAFALGRTRCGRTWATGPPQVQKVDAAPSLIGAAQNQDSFSDLGRILDNWRLDWSDVDKIIIKNRQNFMQDLLVLESSADDDFSSMPLKISVCNALGYQPQDCMLQYGDYVLEDQDSLEDLAIVASLNG